MNAPSIGLCLRVCAPLAIFQLAMPATAAPGFQDLSVLYDGLAPSIVTIATQRNGARAGIGTGVIVHADGFIVTAAHVVEGANVILAHFKDGEPAKARIVTLSRTEDLALLKVEHLPKLSYVPELGDSDKLKVGQPLFMIGTPLGLTHTVTQGIVSGLRKTERQTMTMPYLPERLIQTDAAMNQGNSGGAVFNADGQIVGIASFIASPSGGSVGLGFAIPSNAVRRRLFEHALPYIGLSLRRVTPELAAIFHWPANTLLIERVDESSAAGKAGLRGGTVKARISNLKISLGGDLIVSVGGFKSSQSKKIHTYLHDLKVGDEIAYVVVRAAKTYNVRVPVIEPFEVPKLKPPTKFNKRRKRRKKR